MNPLERRTENPDFVTRPYTPRDRDRVRFICCETGFLGEPIDSVFSDRDVFADYLTRYYTDVEPESCWVGEKNGEVVSYLLACRRWNLNWWWNLWNGVRLAGKVVTRLLLGRYDASSRNFLKWSILKGRSEMPVTPPKTAHFHLNSLKKHRKMGIARDLMMTMFEEFKKRGVKNVYAQMMTYDTRRTEKVYDYLGLKVIGKQRVTKYQDRVDREMYLTTIIKDLSESGEKSQENTAQHEELAL